MIHRGWSNSLPLTRLTARWFTVFVGFFSPFFFLLLLLLLLSWHQACALRRALCQEHNLLQSGRLERWRGVERGGGGGEWGETVIFSSGPEGSPSLYKALWAAQELHSSYLLQEHGQQAAAAAAAGWSSHKGIIQLSLSLSLSLSSAQRKLSKQLDTYWEKIRGEWARWDITHIYFYSVLNAGFM